MKSFCIYIDHEEGSEACYVKLENCENKDAL